MPLIGATHAANARTPWHDACWTSDCAPGGDSVIRALCRVHKSGRPAGHPAGAGDPDEAVRQAAARLPLQAGDPSDLDAPPDDRWSGQRDRIMFATLYNTAPGSRSSPVLVWAMSSWTGAPACTSMAKDARIEASRCGGPRRHSCDTGCHGLTVGQIGRSFQAPRADV